MLKIRQDSDLKQDPLRPTLILSGNKALVADRVKLAVAQFIIEESLVQILERAIDMEESRIKSISNAT